jgi:hypothetical protein
MKAVKHWEHLNEIVVTLTDKVQVTNPYLFVVLMLEICNPSNKSKKIGGAITKIIRNNMEFI